MVGKHVISRNPRRVKYLTRFLWLLLISSTRCPFPCTPKPNTVNLGYAYASETCVWAQQLAPGCITSFGVVKRRAKPYIYRRKIMAGFNHDRTNDT